ncbi:MAG: hypothetical protein ACRC8K_04800 [Waterburya sp.]
MAENQYSLTWSDYILSCKGFNQQSIFEDSSGDRSRVYIRV